MTEPHIAEVEGLCLAVIGYEEDYLDFIETETRSSGLRGINSFIPEELRVNSSETPAFERVGSDWDEPMWAEHRKEYIERTGRQLPPLLKVKVRVEVVEASAEETAAYWAQEQAKMRELPYSWRTQT